MAKMTNRHCAAATWMFNTGVALLEETDLTGDMFNYGDRPSCDMFN